MGVGGDAGGGGRASLSPAYTNPSSRRGFIIRPCRSTGDFGVPKTLPPAPGWIVPLTSLVSPTAEPGVVSPVSLTLLLMSLVVVLGRVIRRDVGRDEEGSTNDAAVETLASLTSSSSSPQPVIVDTTTGALADNATG